MPWFRAPARPAGEVVSPDSVRRVIAELISPAHFFVGEHTALSWEFDPRCETAWELFDGRLLPASQTRRRQIFEAWNVYTVERGTRSDEPLLSVKLDVDEALLHVTRAVLCHVHEPFDAGGVIETREVERWVPELVGTLRLDLFRDLAEFQDELTCRLFQAVVGTSRLPLTSLEAPLPAFTLGRLAYFSRPEWDATASMRTPCELLERGLGNHLGWIEKAKLLETYLRATSAEETADAAERFLVHWQALGHTNLDICDLMLTVFNEVSLSPWTGLADAAIGFVKTWEERSLLPSASAVDLLASLLQPLGRHLTAFDLVTFHHLGANYPDALLLDTLLKALLHLSESRPDLLLGDGERERWRRRALRQGWLLRRRYEGHPVPEAPTSPGENLRVLPGPHLRVPEDQILQPHRRPRRLYADDPLDSLSVNGRAALHRSLDDLHDPRELWELGTALFLDRPFGVGKRPTEPDQTLLFSYIAFSPSIARHRLDYLTDRLEVISKETRQTLSELLSGNLPIGLPMPQLKPSRPGVVSLADAWKVADDFLLLRTTSRTVRALKTLYGLDDVNPRLVVGDPELPGVRWYDDALRPGLELIYDPQWGYESRGGVEYPLGGLRVVGRDRVLRTRDGWRG